MDGRETFPSTVEPRTTKQRTAIRDLLAGVGEFRSAQQLHAMLQAQGTSIGLATVYRTLGLLAESGEIDVLMRADGEALYRRCSDTHHHHLVCRRCGTTVEVVGPSIEAWAREVSALHGFTNTSHTVEIFGVCPTCADLARARGEQ